MPNNVNTRLNQDQQEFYDNMDSGDLRRKTSDKENKAAGAGGQALGATSGGNSVTLVGSDGAVSPEYGSSIGSATSYDVLPPSSVSLSVAMRDLQGVSGKINSNQSLASMANVKSSQLKEHDSTVDFENQMKTAEEQAAKAEKEQKKQKKNGIFNFISDAVEFVIGAAETVGGALSGDVAEAGAGLCMMGAAVVNATETGMEMTGTLSSKEAKRMDIAQYSLMGASLLLSLGSNAWASYMGGAADATADATTGTEDAIEMTDMSSSAGSGAEDGGEIAENSENAANNSARTLKRIKFAVQFANQMASSGLQIDDGILAKEQGDATNKADKADAKGAEDQAAITVDQQNAQNWLDKMSQSIKQYESKTNLTTSIIDEISAPNTITAQHMGSNRA